MNEQLLARARDFGTHAHARTGQTYGGKPYSVHLAAVEAVLVRFGHATPEIRAAAWLHDTVEDCDVTLGEVQSAFGARVAEMVGAVTYEPGENRKERATATYPKIRSTLGAVILKLADRIANVEASIHPESDPGHLATYRREHHAFRAALRTPDPAADAMWEHLDSLLAETRR